MHHDMRLLPDEAGVTPGQVQNSKFLLQGRGPCNLSVYLSYPQMYIYRYIYIYYILHMIKLSHISFICNKKSLSIYQNSYIENYMFNL